MGLRMTKSEIQDLDTTDTCNLTTTNVPPPCFWCLPKDKEQRSASVYQSRS
jgi:hypothetical protein